MASTSPSIGPDAYISDLHIGLSLALLSTLFIGSSFVIKKLGLLRLGHRGGLRAGSGGFGYLKDWVWWLGLITMGVGEMANFAAYAFAPATLVTPLGALSILVSTLLASKILNERLNLLGKLSCLLCILGSSVIVIHSREDESFKSLGEMLKNLRSASFITYVIFVIATAVAISFYFGPKYGSRYICVYLVLCSAVGSLTVLTCKALGLAIKEVVIEQSTEVNHLVIYVLFVTVFTCIFIQMNYLNKALDWFDTSIVTPVYYVIFTSLVNLASTTICHEWSTLSGVDIWGNLCGFWIIVIAIFMLCMYKDVEVTTVKVKSDAMFGDRYYGYQSTQLRIG